MRLGAICAAAALCTGCPNPNTYGTPRTTPVGKIQHNVAAEGFGYSGHDVETNTDVSGALPTFPTYTLRVGVADTVDIGARIANLSSVGADVKWNFLKGDTLDLAIDPGFQAFYFSTSSGGEDASIGVIYLNAPLMVGINLGDSVSIVPTLGVSYGIATASVNGSSGRDSATGSSGIMLRPGLGFDFRISERFAIHPEITFLKTLKGSDEDSSLLYVFGLGFNFGNLPKYGGGGEPPKE
jgi:hypothetical protein